MNRESEYLKITDGELGLIMEWEYQNCGFGEGIPHGLWIRFRENVLTRARELSLKNGDKDKRVKEIPNDRK